MVTGENYNLHPTSLVINEKHVFAYTYPQIYQMFHIEQGSISNRKLQFPISHSKTFWEISMKIPIFD